MAPKWLEHRMSIALRCLQLRWKSNFNIALLPQDGAGNGLEGMRCSVVLLVELQGQQLHLCLPLNALNEPQGD